MRMSKLPGYGRVLLKVSGEALQGKTTEPFDPEFLDYLGNEISEVAELGYEVGIVVGGGNIFRGLSGKDFGVERVTGDYMGMLATLINCLAISEALNRKGCKTRVLSPFFLPQVSDAVSWVNARQALEEGFVVLFAGGTGNPFFTTDSAAVLRALEAGCRVVLKATKVNGVYDKDPSMNPDAVFMPRLTYDEALSRNLGVMDATAFSLCREHHLPIVVFNIFEPGNIRRAVMGERVGSLVN
ncbi:MAG: UMP kinase [Acidobacteria bacterium]|nr:UMP kinase [Acidobacteriota bacterium]